VRKWLAAISILEMATAEQLRKQLRCGLNFLKEFWQMENAPGKTIPKAGQYKALTVNTQ